jgi:hypothetical protein
MSQPSPSLHAYVDARFREAFGDPHTSMGQDDHWRLQGSPSHLPINVLLNGTRDIPVLWVFDTQDENSGVFNASITQESQVYDLIEQIQKRVKRAPGAKTA